MESTRALSEDALLSGLRDIHLPANAPGGVVADLLAALFLGLILALLCGLAVRLFTTARAKRSAPTLSDRIAQLGTKPEAERQLALLHLLRSEAPERYNALKSTLYRPDGLPSAAELEAELVRHA